VARHTADRAKDRSGGEAGARSFSKRRREGERGTRRQNRRRGLGAVRSLKLRGPVARHTADRAKDRSGARHTADRAKDRAGGEVGARSFSKRRGEGERGTRRQNRRRGLGAVRSLKLRGPVARHTADRAEDRSGARHTADRAKDRAGGEVGARSFSKRRGEGERGTRRQNRRRGLGDVRSLKLRGPVARHTADRAKDRAGARHTADRAEDRSGARHTADRAKDRSGARHTADRAVDRAGGEVGARSFSKRRGEGERWTRRWRGRSAKLQQAPAGKGSG
jgi:hypothetical protein